MKLSRQTFWGMAILLLGGVPLLITGGLIYRGYRLQSVNRVMITAIKRNDLPEVAALLAQGADPNAREWPPYTKYLWEYIGSGPYPEGQSKTALMLTLELDKENIPLVKTLLNAGASVDAANELGSTELICAIKASRGETVRLLLARGAHVDARDHDGNLPLHHAAYTGQTAIAHLLLMTQPDTRDAQNKAASTPLDYAVRSYSPDCVAELLRRGAQVNVRDHDGDTPLSTAVRNRQEGSVHLLLAAGALVNTQNKEGRTPLSYALESKNTKIVKMLTEAGANKEVGASPVNSNPSIRGGRE